MQRRPEMQVRVHGRNADLQPVQLSGRHLCKSPRYRPLHLGALWPAASAASAAGGLHRAAGGLHVPWPRTLPRRLP
eukprot:scaffold24056_cov60-Phaeocystis_antarctica.AAC.1